MLKIWFKSVTWCKSYFIFPVFTNFCRTLYAHKSNRWNTGGNFDFYAYSFWKKEFLWFISASVGHMALIFGRNHNLESLRFLSGEDRDHNSGHQLVSARVLLNLLNLALLMLIFLALNCFIAIWDALRWRRLYAREVVYFNGRLSSPSRIDCKQQPGSPFK